MASVCTHVWLQSYPGLFTEPVGHWIPDSIEMPSTQLTNAPLPHINEAGGMFVLGFARGKLIPTSARVKHLQEKNPRKKALHMAQALLLVQ